jgi:Flp pilus assembly pilin Flp
MSQKSRPSSEPSKDACDRGVAMVTYALMVAMISIVAVVAIRTVGNNTSSEFTSIANALQSVIPGASAEPEMTPKEKWQQAQADWSAAYAQANDDYQAAVAQAAAIRDAQKEANKSLPKAEKKVANQQANAEFNSAKGIAKNTQLSIKQAADEKKALAKAEYQATK